MNGYRKPTLITYGKTNQTKFKFTTACYKCGHTISIGSRVVSRAARSRKYYHELCAKEMGLI